MSRQVIDLSGQRFGRLVAVDRAQSGKWNCVCDCGSTKAIASESLKYGNTRSCGCLNREATAKRNRENPRPRVPKDDLTGRRFGRWTAVAYIRTATYQCRCECGKENAVKRCHLLSGMSQSCGCLRDDLAVARTTHLRLAPEVLKEHDALRGKRYRQKEKFKQTRSAYEKSTAGRENRARWIRSEKGRKAAHRRAALLRAAEGNVSLGEWNRIKEIWGHRCAYCGTLGKLTQDHVVPLSRGGKHVPTNLVPACVACNVSKWRHPVDGWLVSKGHNVHDFWTRQEHACMILEKEQDHVAA